MAYETLTLGLTLTLPTSGTRSWATSIKNTTWTKISSHDHTGSGNGATLVTGSYTDYSVTTVKLARNSGRTQYASTLAPAGTTQTVDWANGVIQKLSLASASGDVTLTLSNPGTGCTYKLIIDQGATARDLTWPAAVKWANGQAPILSTVPSSIDIVSLYFDGTNYFGDWDVAYA